MGSLIHPANVPGTVKIFRTFLGSPCLSPLWFGKISWRRNYRTIQTVPHFLLNKRELRHISIQREVYACLEAMFSSKWIRRAGAVPWISCSPHLTPLDFRLWRFVKDVVYIPATPTHLRPPQQHIRQAVTKVNWDVRQRKREELNYLGDICTETEGTRIWHHQISLQCFLTTCYWIKDSEAFRIVQKHLSIMWKQVLAQWAVKWKWRVIEWDAKNEIGGLQILKSYRSAFCTEWEVYKESIQLLLSFEPGNYQILHRQLRRWILL
jgi:hypothetical protein